METLALIVACIGLVCVAISPWFVGDANPRIRQTSRVALGVGGFALYGGSLMYSTTMFAILVLAIPLSAIAVWWGGVY